MKRVVVMASCVGLVVLLACGCATKPKGPTDEEAIEQAIQQAETVIKAKDITALMTFVSERFASDRFGDKYAIENLLKMGMGFLDNVEIDRSGAKTVITKDKVTVTPVLLKCGIGTVTLHFTGAKEKGVWKAIAAEGEGGNF